MADKRVTLSDVIMETETGLLTLDVGSPEHKNACEALQKLLQAQAALDSSKIEEQKISLEAKKATSSEALEKLKLELMLKQFQADKKKAKKAEKTESAKNRTERIKAGLGFAGVMTTAAVGIGTFLAALNVDQEGRFVENRNAFDVAKGNARASLTTKK